MEDTFKISPPRTASEIRLKRSKVRRVKLTSTSNRPSKVVGKCRHGRAVGSCKQPGCVAKVSAL